MALTETMRRELDENGFTVLESFLQGAELERISSAMQSFAEDPQGTTTNEFKALPSGAEATPGVDSIALEMMDYAPLLPYLVDAVGWNIAMRDGLQVSIPPAVAGGVSGDETGVPTLGTAWHIDQQEEFQGITHDGTIPLMEIKISYYLSDATREGHACTLLVPGSHRWTPHQRDTWEQFVKPEDVVPLRVPKGSVLLWRSTMLHGVTPHYDTDAWRLHLMYSYVPRWFRPSFRGTFRNIANDQTLLERSSPIRRQLLGHMGDLSEDGLPRNSPLYLFPQNDEQVPLKTWAEAHGCEQYIAGTTGHGASNSNHLNLRPSPTMHTNSAMCEKYTRPGAWREVTCTEAPEDETPAQMRTRQVALELEVRQLRARLESLEGGVGSKL